MERMRRVPVANAIVIFWIAVAVSISLTSVFAMGFPHPVDELAHLSYVASVARQAFWHLDFRTMHLLHRDLSPGFGDELTWLNHPPWYYLLLSLLMPSDGWPTMETVYVLRLVNAALSTGAIACVLIAGAVRGLSPWTLFVYGALVTLVPMLSVVGGGINNDNLALLGGGMTVLGAQLMETRDSRAGGVLVLSGPALAALAKLTSGLMVIAFAVMLLALRWWNRRTRPPVWMLAAMATMIVVSAIPYLRLALIHGSPAPITPTFEQTWRNAATGYTRLLAEHSLATLHGWTPGQRLGAAAYALVFAHWLLAAWNPTVITVGVSEFARLAAPVCVLLFAAAAWISQTRRGASGDRIILAGGLAISLLLPVHAALSWRMHLAVGSPPFDAQPRYYLPLALAIVPMAACWSLERLPRSIQLTLGVMVVTAFVLAEEISIRMFIDGVPD
jgi:hypothetical protein